MCILAYSARIGRPRGVSPLCFLSAMSAAVLTAASSGGCRSAHPEDWTVASRPVPAHERAIDAAAGTEHEGPMELTDAIAYALSSHPRINALRAAIHRTSGDAAQTLTPRPPELRFGYGREDESSRGWAQRTETGTRRRSGTEAGVSRETGSETSESERWEWGWPTETSSSFREFASNDQSARTYEQRGQYRNSAYSTDIGSQAEDGFRVGLRYYPPNPWMRSADGDAARARIGLMQAELAAEEHALMCEITEAAVQAAYGERILRAHDAFVLRCRALSDEIQQAMDAGFLSRGDYLDARLRLASAEADRARAASRLASWRQRFRACSGVDPARIALDSVAAGAFCPALDDPAQWADRARALASRRPDVRAAYWNWIRHDGEWRSARSAAFPWFNYLEVAYSRWDVTDRRTRTVEESGRESRSTQQQSAGSSSRTETEERISSDFTTESSSSARTSFQSASSLEQDYESSSGWATEWARGEADGDEWWVGLAVEIPIFEWMSGARGERRRARSEALRGYDLGRGRAEREILMAGAALTESLAGLAESRITLGADQREIDELAREFEDLGLEGKLEAMRLRERGVDMDVLLLNRELDLALDELHFCRTSGLPPGRPGSAGPEATPAKEPTPAAE